MSSAPNYTDQEKVIKELTQNYFNQAFKGGLVKTDFEKDVMGEPNFQKDLIEALGKGQTGFDHIKDSQEYKNLPSALQTEIETAIKKADTNPALPTDQRATLIINVINAALTQDKKPKIDALVSKADTMKPNAATNTPTKKQTVEFLTDLAKVLPTNEQNKLKGIIKGIRDNKTTSENAPLPEPLQTLIYEMAKNNFVPAATAALKAATPAATTTVTSSAAMAPAKTTSAPAKSPGPQTPADSGKPKEPAKKWAPVKTGPTNPAAQVSAKFEPDAHRKPIDLKGKVDIKGMQAALLQKGSAAFGQPIKGQQGAPKTDPNKSAAPAKTATSTPSANQPAVPANTQASPANQNQGATLATPVNQTKPQTTAAQQQQTAAPAKTTAQVQQSSPVDTRLIELSSALGQQKTQWTESKGENKETPAPVTHSKEQQAQRREPRIESPIDFKKLKENIPAGDRKDQGDRAFTYKTARFEEHTSGNLRATPATDTTTMKEFSSSVVEAVSKSHSPVPAFKLNGGTIEQAKEICENLNGQGVVVKLSPALEDSFKKTTDVKMTEFYKGYVERMKAETKESVDVNRPVQP